MEPVERGQPSWLGLDCLDSGCGHEKGNEKESERKDEYSTTEPD